VPYRGGLYAADRRPSQAEGNDYENKRGVLLRLGMADVSPGDGQVDWEEARRISLLKNRPDSYTMIVCNRW
jgi:hypothetical protein